MIYIPYMTHGKFGTNTIFSINHISNGLAHPRDKFSHWSDCSLTENSLRHKLTECNQRYLPCETEITIHLCCVKETLDFCRALRIQPSAVIPALAAPSPDTRAVLCCVQLVRECLKHLVIFRLVWTWDGHILTAGGLAAGILVAVLTNANEITTFLLIPTWKFHRSASVHSNAPCISEKEDSA